MELKNKKNTPDIMMEVLANKPYLAAGTSDYSATSLIEPPRIVQLKKRYGHLVKDDAMDKWNIFLGNALHEKIEKELQAYPHKYITERKFVEFLYDRKIVAKLDAYDVENNILYDHKTCKTFAYSNNHKPEWEHQLNINAWFLHKDGIHPERAVINALMLDWMAGMAKFKGADDYPQNPMMLFDIPLWSEEEQESFVKERLEMHIAAETTPDEELPGCTEEEMWAKPDTFAVKRKDVYVAKRVLPTKEEAEAWMSNSRVPDLYIEARPGERVRCENYCRVKEFCSQYQDYKEAQNGTGS